ncbi:MAG: hypothetical protein ABIY70_23410 [Capsulimonas sp.]|uniref:bpX5 domain-containing protein n=1 Tax=Capsulimonas sp. TaxID=2494211 RepID=UPI003264ED14
MPVSSPNLTTITWRTRDLPLEPVGVAASGAAAIAMARRLLDASDETLAALTGVSGDGFLIVLGPADQLPWADGVVYLGRDPSAAALFTPTTHIPSVPLALLAGALALRHPEVKPPLALVPNWPALVSFASARAIARETLAEWRRTEETR